MISDVDVCNKALNYLQAGKIQSLDDNTASAIACRTVFDTIRDSVLADYAWAFATTIVSPVLIPSEVLVGWEYLYATPLDCLAVRKLFIDDSTTDPEPIEFRECLSPSTEVKAIAVNILDPYLEYTKQIVDAALWSVKFSDAMALRLAAEIGARITGKQEYATEAASRYGVSISEAKRMDGSTKNVKKTRTSSYEDAR